MNTLYYGDNLKILRDYIKDESVDLIYLDPPFNSNRNYNVLFRNEAGSEAESQTGAKTCSRRLLVWRIARGRNNEKKERCETESCMSQLTPTEERPDRPFSRPTHAP